MAGYYRYTVVLDACVLYPAPLRDLLLSLAAAGVFHARWTQLIQDEWVRNLAVNRPDLNPRERLRKPRKTAQEMIATYEMQGLPQTCKILRGRRGSDLNMRHSRKSQ
jgi:hypothetical protein